MNVRPVMVILALAVLPAGALGVSSMTFHLAPADSSSVLPGDDPLVLSFNDGSYFTFDLMITTVDTYFIGAAIDATLTGPSEFFQHPEGGLVPPDPNLVQQYPAVEFDSFFDGGPANRIFVAWESLVQEAQFIHADWGVDGGWYTGDGTYRIARFSFHFLAPGTAALAVEGVTVNPFSPGPLIPIGPLVVSVDYVPEPSMPALLTLGGLLGLRRRA